MILQEKFQTTLPGKIESGESWAEVKSQQKHYSQEYLCLPSTGIEEPVIEDNGMKLVLAGSTDVTDNVNMADLRRGFDNHDMRGTDDLYTGEHADLFYGDAGGFVERNNYLDRN